MVNMSNILRLPGQATTPLALVRARAKVLAREDRKLRSELVRVRRQRKLTQKDVADQLGVSPQAIQKLERYDADPKLSTLRRYANAIGALVEHRVCLDEGQSIAIANGSRWESSTPSTDSPDEPWRFETTSAPAPLIARSATEWSESRRVDYALGA